MDPDCSIFPRKTQQARKSQSDLGCSKISSLEFLDTFIGDAERQYIFQATGGILFSPWVYE